MNQLSSDKKSKTLSFWYGLRILLLCFISTSFHVYAGSVNCSATMSDLNFGSKDLLFSSNNINILGQLDYQCVNNTTEEQKVAICFTLSDPGNMGTYSMAGPNGDSVTFQMLNVDTLQVWTGSTSQPAMFINTSIPPGIGQSVTGNIPVKGFVTLGQSSKTPGAYSYAFPAGNTQIYWRNSSVSTPSSCDLGDVTTGDGFNVDLQVVPNCNVTANDFAFGAVDPNSAQDITASSTVNVSCSPNTNYSLMLSSNYAHNGDFNMINIGDTGQVNRLSYYLSTDQNFNQLLLPNISQSGLVGNGTQQSISLYGKVLSNHLKTAPGMYSDMVMITITY